MADRVQLRLAMRVEGDRWVAYAAQVGTMHGAAELGSVKMGVVSTKKRKDAFMGLMRDYLSDFIAASTGTRPEWNDPEPGPEHERAGRA